MLDGLECVVNGVGHGEDPHVEPVGNLPVSGILVKGGQVRKPNKLCIAEDLVVVYVGRSKYVFHFKPDCGCSHFTQQWALMPSLTVSYYDQ